MADGPTCRFCGTPVEELDKPFAEHVMREHRKEARQALES